jgi:hypothetical protein
MTTVFFAHSFGADRSEWKTLHIHLQHVSHLAREFGARFGAGEIAALMGRLHDVGKYHPDFLRRSTEKRSAMITRRPVRKSPWNAIGRSAS